MKPPQSENSATSSGNWRPPVAGEHRSPCPALNALANGGHIPRSGIVTSAEIVAAAEAQLGIAPSFTESLVRTAMDQLGRPGPDGVKVLNLADLAEHGVIEHDASLTRKDAHRGSNVEVCEPLVDQLVALSKDQKTLTLEDLA